MVAVRDANSPPSDSIEHTPTVEVHHPGYFGENVLLRWPVLDESNDGEKRGIDYTVLHTACAIIANNKFNGFLSSSRERY